MPNELKPCPFCGKTVACVCSLAEALGKDGNDYDMSHYTVVCDYVAGGCGSSIGQFYNTKDEAKEAWNRRVTDNEMR